MNEVNDNGRLDQPLVRPPEEAASGEPQGVRPSVASYLLELANEWQGVVTRYGSRLTDLESSRCRARADLLRSLAKQAERERWTREHDRTA